MPNSDSNEDFTDSLNEEQNEEANKIQPAEIESVEDVYKTYRPQSSQEMSGSPKSVEENLACSTSKSEDKNSESDSDSDYSSFLKHMSVRYSHYRIDSGEVRQPKGQTMDYRDYSYSQYPVGGASCNWQSSGRNGQNFATEAQMESPSYASQDMPERDSYYSYGQPLPEANSASDETIVNQPRATSAASEDPRCSTHSCNYCCPMRQPGQQPSSWGNPGQEQLMHMPMPMGIDPSTGYPLYCYPASGSYPGTGMCSMPAMQMDQTSRGGGGQHNAEMNSNSSSGSPSSSSSASMGSGNASLAGGANQNQSPNSFDMEAFMQKYQQSLQQCYATAQQGLQQSFANANAQSYFNNSSQGTQQYYANSNPGTQQIFASSNQAATPQYYDNSNQEAQSSLAYQGMPQPFSSPLGAQPFYTSSSLGAQHYLPPSMPMPASNYFGNNTGFISDTLHTQTVYSSDYKSFANEGNHFNHFPNGMDIGLAPESLPGYGQAGSPVLAEMSAGGQVYGMGGGCEMNMNSYPLSQMSYSSPYSYEMPASSAGYHPGSSPKMQAPHGGIPM